VATLNNLSVNKAGIGYTTAPTVTLTAPTFTATTANWDMTINEQRPYTWTSADAAGLPVFRTLAFAVGFAAQAVLALAIFKVLPVTLTLAGMAGFVLSVPLAIGSPAACTPPAKTAASASVEGCVYDGDVAFGPAMRVKRFHLKNGLRVVTTPVPTSQAASVNVFIGVGSRAEARRVNGVSHYLEHMLFKGTDRRPDAITIAEAIEGAGGVLNAYTGKELTCYLSLIPI